MGFARLLSNDFLDLLRSRPFFLELLFIIFFGKKNPEVEELRDFPFNICNGD